MSELLLVGLSHHSAPVSIREKIAVGESRLAEALRDLGALPSVEESFVVSTCNRVEVYAASKGGEEATKAIRAYLSSRDRNVDAHLYQRHGLDAVRHLFRVCSSLDSMVLGEPQILGQVKEAFATAEEAGAVGRLLSRSCRRAFAVAKRVRTETQVGRAAVSMSFAAVELASKILGSIEGRTVLLVGAGKMSTLAARHFVRAGAARVMVVNRSAERARELAEEVGGEAHPWESLPQRLVDADVVVCSTASAQPVITVDLALAARKARKHRPLFIVDLAVPRDVDPKVNSLDGLFVYDVDDINRVIGENLRARQEEAARAEEIVGEEARAFVSALQSEAAPIVRELRIRGEAVAKAELEKTLSRIGEGLSPAQQRGLEALTKAIVNKLLHEPTLRLREAGERDDGALLEAGIRLFGLEAEAGVSTPAVEAVAERPDGAETEPDSANVSARNEALKPAADDGKKKVADPSDEDETGTAGIIAAKTARA